MFAHIFTGTFPVSNEWHVYVITDQIVIILLYILVTTKFISQCQPAHHSVRRVYISVQPRLTWWASWPWGRTGVTVCLQQLYTAPWPLSTSKWIDHQRQSWKQYSSCQRVCVSVMLSHPPPWQPDLARHTSIQTQGASVCPLLTFGMFSFHNEVTSPKARGASWIFSAGIPEEIFWNEFMWCKNYMCFFSVLRTCWVTKYIKSFIKCMYRLCGVMDSV